MGSFVNKWGYHIIAWIYTLFIGLFAFDEKIFSFGFLVHQIPFFVLVAINILSIKYRKYAGILYVVLFVIFTILFQTYRELSVFLFISLPLLILGIVFLRKKTGSKL